MSKENEDIGGVMGDEMGVEGSYTMDATGAVVSTETAKEDKRFDEETGGNDWREQA